MNNVTRIFETVKNERVKAERLNSNQERQLKNRFYKSNGEKDSSNIIKVTDNH